MPEFGDDAGHDASSPLVVPEIYLDARAGEGQALSRREVLGRFRLLERPETVLRWHRDLLARRHAAKCHPGAQVVAEVRARGTRPFDPVYAVTSRT